MRLIKPRRLFACLVVLTAVTSLAASNARDVGSDNRHGSGHRGVSLPQPIADPFASLQKIIPPMPEKHLETGPFIDGAQTPEKIPDGVAYAQFFRMLRASDASSEGQRRQVSYMRHVLRSAGRDPSEPEIEALRQFVASYQRRLDEFDEKRTPNSDEGHVALEIARTMPGRVGRELAFSLDWYVKTRFKRNVKIIFGAAH